MTSTTASPQKREGFFDNARFWLILLVVVGHSLPLLIGTSDFARSAYLWMYFFHMPAFVLLTGYLSRNFTYSWTNMVKTAEVVLTPYIVIELTIQLLWIHYGRLDSVNLLTPVWAGWFLLAMIFWRLLTPIFRHLPYAPLWAIGVSLLAPVFTLDATFALPKVLGLLPFYIIGVNLKKEHFEFLKSSTVRVASAIFLTACFGFTWFISRDWPVVWLLWKRAYGSSELNVSVLEGTFTRFALILLALAMTAAFLALVSWTKSIISSMGQRTLYCYLLHGVIIILLREELHLFQNLRDWSGPGVLVTIVGALALALLLLTPQVASIARWFFTWDLPRLIKSKLHTTP